ncbi:unnamed protein product [Rotaria sordida]|uniref:Uncharacterized protein n=1 Tax=Rotaria sordida TaxID=392033 RepID=A0A819NZA0_9BILA|nr:unnamed protein product [Rotaria sordida]CAF4007720.1 unnamed protein product [Rotaria sordida]
MDEHSKECSYINEDPAPGVTHSSITIIRAHDKSTSTSPLHTSTAVDFCTSSFSSLEYRSKSTQTDDTISTPSIKKKLNLKLKKKIARRLNLTIKELQECKDDYDIRKTCRHITQRLYPDEHTRASMKISNMSNQQKKDIRDYAKILHRDQNDAKKYYLNNAIGNVFASAKNNKKKKKT